MRKEQVITIPAEGKRDAGKKFHLQEMPAMQAEAWATRALLALAASGVDLPENFMSMGLAGMAVVGVKALGGVEYERAKPLLDEMLACVSIMPDDRHPEVRRKLMEDDIEEVATLMLLRKEILNLHVDFFTDAGLLSKVRAQMQTPAD